MTDNPEGPVYGTPYPPQTYGSPVSPPSSGVYGSPAPRPDGVYGPPTPATYGTPAAYDNPGAYDSPAAYGNPVSGGALQPYPPVPASPAVPYGPAYPQPGYPAVPDSALVPPGARFGAFLLDLLLAIVTLWIGWFIWALVTWKDGQTPAKKMLGHVVVDANTGQRFDWGRMALREFVIKGLLGGLLNAVTLDIYFLVDSFMVFGARYQTAHDKMATSVTRYI